MCKLPSAGDIPGIPKLCVLGLQWSLWLSVTAQRNLLRLEVQFMAGSRLVKSLIRIASQWEICCALYRALAFHQF